MLTMGDDVTTKTMKLRYPGHCRDCGTQLPAGTTAVYDKAAGTVQCLTCRTGAEPPVAEAPPPVESGTAGASARREFERRAARREANVRAAHPRVGGLLLALFDDPQTTKAWATGARGEEVLGRGLDRLAEAGVRVLHDRRIRGTRANIDHIAAGPSGVHVIDAKRYAGKRPELRVEGGILRPRVEKLIVGTRNCSALVAGVLGQVGKVRVALDNAGLEDVPVHGTLCFMDANWPLFGGSFAIDGVAVLWPKRLAERLLAAGPLDQARIDEADRALAAAFPIA